VPQSESCEVIEPLVLEQVPDGDKRVILFAARYHYGRKTFDGYVSTGVRAASRSLTLPPATAALACANWVHGWITDKQRTWLYNTAGTIKRPAVIVEIGAWKGKSSILLGWGSKSGDCARVYSIDPHAATPLYWIQHGGVPVSTWEQYQANIMAAGVADVVIPIRDSSENVVKYMHTSNIGLLFVDGDHDFAAQDVMHWWPLVAVGGWLALHDAQRAEVGKAVELMRDTGSFSEPDTIDSMVVMRRTA
jgi:predicted O-methyltransferase YrrM